MPSLSETERISLIEHTLWGRHGSNGVVGDVKAIRADLQAFIAAEATRREVLARDEVKSKRLIALSAFAAVVSLIGIVATLLVVLIVGPG